MRAGESLDFCADFFDDGSIIHASRIDSKMDDEKHNTTNDKGEKGC